MDINKENTKYLASLLANCGATQDEINDLSFDDEVGFFESNRLADWFVSQINFGWRVWQAAKAQAVPEWISVGDSLPPVDETVLVCWDYAADIEPEKEYLTLDEDYNEYWPNCQDEPPTHWLPLPKVTKAQEKANEL